LVTLWVTSHDCLYSPPPHGLPFGFCTLAVTLDDLQLLVAFGYTQLPVAGQLDYLYSLGYILDTWLSYTYTGLPRYASYTPQVTWVYTTLHAADYGLHTRAHTHTPPHTTPLTHYTHMGSVHTFASIAPVATHGYARLYIHSSFVDLLLLLLLRYVARSHFDLPCSLDCPYTPIYVGVVTLLPRFNIARNTRLDSFGLHLPDLARLRDLPTFPVTGYVVTLI